MKDIIFYILRSYYVVIRSEPFAFFFILLFFSHMAGTYREGGNYFPSTIIFNVMFKVL